MSYALINATIFDGNKLLKDHSVVVEGARVKDIVFTEILGDDVARIDLEGALLAPGFVDLQVNGGGGVLFNDDISVTGLKTIAQAHLRYGTTSFLPTLITTSFADMKEAIKVTREAKQKIPQVLGLHLEGPFINLKKRGTHNPMYVRKAADVEIEEIADNADVVRVITVAPEAVTPKQVNLLSSKGIKVSIGHTDATKENTQSLERAGASMYTHLFNAMSQLQSRELGVVGAALFSKTSYAGIIVDGFHVDLDNVQIAIKSLGDRLFLVTDAMPPVGSNQKQFSLGPLEVVCEDGKCINNEGALAGSALNMAQAVRNMVYEVGIGITQALAMASLYPARALRIENLGRISQGFPANFVILSPQIEVMQVVQEGLRIDLRDS